MKLYLGLACFVALVGCGNGGQARPASTPADSEGTELVAAVEGVCAAADKASGSIQKARSLFLDEAHDGIHRLADEVASVDRKLAADVLEAKQAVEAAADASAGRELQRALQRLATAGGDALIALDLETPSCASGGES
ncbi:MAG: hypothetical protein M3280_05355 [Actinomycetota bacterium]|nr:hypothetical protein [Actinomycetota bacterium]